MKKNLAYLTLGLVFALLEPIGSSFAQHPIEVQQQLSKGDYLKALTTFEQIPERRRNVDSHVAAGKSAWALGLPDTAVKEFDIALRDSNINPEGKARLLFSRAVLEFQEERFAESLLYAQHAFEAAGGPSVLRARTLLLWGTVLMATRAYGAADEKLTKSLEESATEDQAEIYFARGRARYHMAQLEAAQQDFEKIPRNNERAAAAVRYLARISLAREDYETAQFWLDKGRSDFPDDFVDAWVDYAAMKIAAATADKEQSKKILDRVASQYPPSDPWRVLVEATAEFGAWNEKPARAQPKPQIFMNPKAVTNIIENSSIDNGGE